MMAADEGKVVSVYNSLYIIHKRIHVLYSSVKDGQLNKDNILFFIRRLGNDVALAHDKLGYVAKPIMEKEMKERSL